MITGSRTTINNEEYQEIAIKYLNLDENCINSIMIANEIINGIDTMRVIISLNGTPVDHIINIDKKTKEIIENNRLNPSGSPDNK